VWGAKSSKPPGKITEDILYMKGGYRGAPAPEVAGRQARQESDVATEAPRHDARGVRFATVSVKELTSCLQQQRGVYRILPGNRR
jgi:hypothetical protein